MPDIHRKHSPARPAAARQSPLWQWGAAAAILLAGIVAYHNSFHVPQVFDCIPFIRDNFTAYNPPTQNVWPATFWTGVNRPVGFVTFGLNFWWSGFDGVWGYHAVNLAIHVVAAWLLFGVVRRTLSRGRLAERYTAQAWALALAIALIWVVHPLQTSSVTYIYQRLEALMALFYLATLWCFIRALDSPRGMWWYAASAICCLLGMATKEVMVTAPLLVLWYDRVFAAGSWRELFAKRAPYYAALACSWPVLARLMAINTFGYSNAGVLVVKGVSPLQYALTEPGVILHYLQLSFWPDRLTFAYDWPVAASAIKIVPPSLIIAGLVALTAWAAYRWPAWGFLGGCFFLILAPTSSVAPIVDPAFEHRMYLPLAAVVTLAVLVCYHAGRRLWPDANKRAPSSSPGLVAAAVLLTVVGLLAWRTVKRNDDYSSEITLWRDTLDQAPNCFSAHVNLGQAYLAQKNIQAALDEVNTAIKLKSDDFDGWYNRGVIYARLGDFHAAIADFNHALEVRPDGVKAFINRGNAYASLGKVKEALADYDEAIRRKGDVPLVYLNRGSIYEKLGQQDPRFYQHALRDYSKAVELKPDSADGYLMLGSVHAALGKTADALANFDRVLRLSPHYAPALAFRARLRATSPDARYRDPAQAVADATQACDLTRWQSVECLDTLAMACADQGNFEKAVHWQTVALEMRPKDPDYQRAARQRLDLYRAGQPYREPIRGGS